MAATLGYDEVRAIYDRIGARQDWQAFYEWPAVTDLIQHSRLDEVGALFEFGCGTGRLAAELLARHLRRDCRYLALDISPTMVGLAREKLEPWGDRAEARLSDGPMELAVADSTFDCFLSTYTLDLLSADDIRRLLAEAHRILVTDGRLALVNLTWGPTPLTGLVSRVIHALHGSHPRLVGGCRPLEVRHYLPPSHWRPDYHNILSAWGLSSEIVLARRLPRQP